MQTTTGSTAAAALAAALLAGCSHPPPPKAPAAPPQVAVLAVHKSSVPVFADLPGRTSPYLIDNAIKYGPQHGSIRVSAMRARNGSIELAVTDTGRGIPDEEKPRVPERFYRGDASRGTPGVGLGLSLVASVAKLHGGRLDLDDNEPGLKATIVLPG